MPDNIFKALSHRFRTQNEEGGALTTERRTVRGLHSFLSNLSSGVDPVPVFERLCLLGFDRDGTVHLMHSLFSVPSGL